MPSMTRPDQQSDDTYDSHLAAAGLQAGLDAALVTIRGIWLGDARVGGPMTRRQLAHAVFCGEPVSQLDYQLVSVASEEATQASSYVSGLAL